MVIVEGKRFARRKSLIDTEMKKLLSPRGNESDIAITLQLSHLKSQVTSF